MSDQHFTVAVNGHRVGVTAPPDTPLLWLLRGELGCTSVKYGCGAEQCGACSTLVDGVSTRTCSLPVSALGGREVVTHEGLEGDDDYEAVVAAVGSHNAGQCGYCLPGIVVTLTELRRQGRQLTIDEMARRLDDHLCRCGSYPRILRAAVACLGGADDRST